MGKTKRILSFILAMLLVLTIVPANAIVWAIGTDEATESTKNESKNETVQDANLPSANVEKLESQTIDQYKIFDLVNNKYNGEGTSPLNPQVLMQFVAKDTPEEAAKSDYADYTTDFYITVKGVNDNAYGKGCYLIGHYGEFGWVVIPLDEVEIENTTYPVITSAGHDFSYEDICTSVVDFKCGIFFSEEFLAANPGVSVSLDLGLSETFDKAQNADYIKVGQTYTYTAADLGLPSASVSMLPSQSISDFRVYDLIGGGAFTDGEGTLDPQVLMEFLATEDPEAAAKNVFANYYADFYINITGLNQPTAGIGCYLIGHYEGFGWIAIPLDEITVENAKYPVISAVGTKFTYLDICTSVKDFKCGIYFSEDFLAANPDMEVSLELGLSKTFDDAQNGIYTKIGDTYTYDVDDLTGKSPVIVPDDLKGDVVEEIKNSTALEGYVPENVPAGAELVIELVEAGKTIVFDVAPMANGEKVENLEEAITFRLPVPASVTIDEEHDRVYLYAKVYHEGEYIGTFDIKGEGNGKYVEISSKDFSEFEVKPVDTFTVAHGTLEIGPANSLAEAIECNDTLAMLLTFSQPGVLPVVTLNGDYTITEDFLANGEYSFVLDLNGKTLTVAEGATLSVGSNIQIIGTGSVVGDVKITDEADASLNVADTIIVEDMTVVDAEDNEMVKGEDGTFVPAPAYVAQVGDNKYTTLTEALAAVTSDTQTVVILADITENLTGAYLRGNITTANGAKVTITLTNTDWVYCPYTFVLGENITLNIPYYGLFYYAGGAVIKGTVVTAVYYQRYAGTKLYIEGSMTVTSETFIIRYTDNDANAGIYVDGGTLNASVIYFYQGMISGTNGATLNVGTYWQTNETDGQGSANLVLDNSTLTVTVYDYPAKATGNSTVTLKNGSTMDCRNGGFTYGENAELIIDATSSLIGKNGVAIQLPVAQIGDNKYATLEDAIAAAQAGDVIEIIADLSDIAIVVDKNLTIKGNVTLNNVSINANGADELTVIGLTFTGNSWINSGSAEKLTVSGVTANVTPSNTAYTNSRSAFISLGRSEQQLLTLTIENCNIVSKGGSDPVLGWASITEATITGSTFGAADAYQTNSDSIKFMSVADGAIFNFVNNTVYSNYNGIVIAQNTTRNNSYTATFDGNTFYGAADHIWLELSVKNTYYGNINAKSNNTINGNAITVDDIKTYNDNGVTGYAGIDVVLNDEGKVIGGTMKFVADGILAEGYELDENGVVTFNPAYGKVAQIGDNYYATIAEALAAAQAGDEVILLADVTLSAELTIPAGIKINGNGKQINGSIVAGGDLTFVGHTKVTMFNAGYNKPVITIGEGACLELTGTGRMVIGHGATFNIVGNISDAKTADKANITPSLIAAGASFTGAGVNFNVTNAYVKFTAYCSSKNSSANGTFNFNVENSIWEQTGSFVFTEPTSGKDPTFNLTLKNSVLDSTSHLVFAVAKGEIVFDNSNVNVGASRQIENRSTLTIKNGSVVNGAVATSSNAKNPGTIIVENATYAVTGEFTGSDVGTGTLVIKKGANITIGKITKANIVIDATDMVAGEIANFTANLSAFAGELSVINNDKLEAKIVDGKIVLSAKPVAQIGDNYYATLEEAFKAATNGCTIEILADVVVDYKWDCRDYATGGSHSQFKESVIINGNGHTIKFTGTVSDGNWNTIFRFEENATVNNLTIDISEATGAQRVISAKKSLTVDGLTIEGAAKYGIIFGEGASADDLAATEIVIKNSDLTGTRRAVSDNEAGKDVKSATLTNNTFNSNVYVSASTSITFTGNIANGEVDLRSYTANNTLNVTATGNTLTAGVKNKIVAGGTIVAQSEFTVPAKGEINVGYVSSTTIWGEGGGNAKESFVIKIYSGSTYLGSATLNNIGGIIDGDVYVTWHAALIPANDNDEYWTTEWAVELTSDKAPDKIELWIDGVCVDSGAVYMNGPDNLNPVKWEELEGVKYVCTGLKGSGTETDPFIINRVEDLILFRDSVNSGETKYNASGVYVVLAADIDLASVENWAPIGTFDYSFDGNFNGQGHKIMNLKMSDSTAANGYAYLGFFGVTANNTVENFVIENVTINSNGQIVAAAIAYPYYTTVKNITVCGDIAIKGGNYTAGVLGYTRLCENASDLTVSGNDGSYITGANVVGGVIADIQMNKGLVANYANFSVSGVTITGNKCVGGIAGIISAQTLNGAKVENVTLVCSDSRVGIVAGSLGMASTISNVTYVNVTGATAIVGGAYDGGAAVQAKVGDTYYATLQDAIDNANGETVVVLTTIVIAKGETAEIDLKGQTVTMVTDSDSVTALILNNGNLTVKDSVGGGKLSYKYTGTKNDDAFNTIESAPGSVLTIEGGIIENLSENCLIAYAIDGLTNGGNGDVTVNIKGGTITSKKIAVRIFANSTTNTGYLNISGGEISGRVIIQNASAKANKAELNITGGTFNANSYKTDVLYVGGSNGASGAITASVSGGAFNGEILSTIATGFITGGTFATDVNEFCADGFKCVANANGTYSITECEYVAQVGDVKYESLQEALNAGGTVVLLTDIELTNRVTINGTVTLDLNGKVISGTCNASQASLIYIENGAELTVKDSAGNGKITYAAGTSNVGWTIDVKGEFVLESGTIELTGTWSIGYAVDVRPNAWGTAYTAPTVFTMNGGNIVSSDGGVRVASSSSATYSNVSASFVMNGGKIDAAWDGVFIQQSDAIYDDLSFTITGGTIESDLNPIRVYGPAATGYVNDQNCMSIVLAGGTMTYTGTETYTWVIDGILRVGGGSSVETIVNNGTVVVSAEIAATTAPEGYKWVANDNGTYTLAECNYVAQVGDVKYESLQDALNAGGTVVLLADITLTEGVIVADETEVILDLNGYTISTTIDETLTKSFALITNNGTLTIDDTVGGGKVSVEYNGASFGYGVGLYTISNAGGTLTVENGTIENLATVSGSMYDAIDNNSTLDDAIVNINGGEIYCAYIAIRQFANSTTHENIINVKDGGEIEGGNCSIWTQNPGNAEPKASIAIEGGNFIGRVLLGESDNFNASIAGGTFTTDVSDYCTEGYECKQNADGSYGVVEKPTINVGVAGLSLTLTDYIKLNYRVNVESLNGRTDLYAVIKITHENCCGTDDVIYETVLDYDDWRFEDDGRVYVDVAKIAAKNMGSTVSVQFFTDDGTAVSISYNYSIEKFAYTVLDGKQSAEFKTAMYSMLVYGAEAQRKFGHATDKCVDARLSDTKYNAYAPTKATADNKLVSLNDELAANNKQYMVSSNLTLVDSIEFNWFFKCAGVTAADVTATVEYKDYLGNDKLIELTAENGYVADVDNGRVRLKISGISVANATADLTIKIYVNGVLTCGMIDSIARQCNSGMNKIPEDTDLYQSILNYSVSVKKYFSTLH